ncbi:hypothetical protein HY750_02130 [Candidatus Kuenenbacteria bacterium]|nr:hypothetical protein [Candidatus Kuenenbacteria bacterium]
MKRYKENPELGNTANAIEVIEKIIESFPTKETKKVCQKILSDFLNLDKMILFLSREENKEILKTLEEKINDWILFIKKIFKEQIKKDFPIRDELNDVEHMWLSNFHGLNSLIEFVKEEKG